jgi:hypothetical protein
MKSRPNFPETRGDRDELASTGGAAILPKVEQFYQSPLREFGGRCRPEDRPSFRSISASYFAEDARRIFVMESALFVVISAIAVLTAVVCAPVVATYFQAIFNA